MSTDLKASIHRYFAELGEDVAEAIYKELLKPGGLQRLLKKLEVPYNPGATADQYGALIMFFRQHGTNEFMQLVGAKPLDFKIENQSPMPTPKPFTPVTGLPKIDQGDTHPIPKVQSAPPLNPPQIVRSAQDTGLIKSRLQDAATPVPTSPDVIPPTRHILPSERRADTPAPGKPVIDPALSETQVGRPRGKSAPNSGIPPEPGTFDKNTPTWNPNKQHDPTGRWPEAERRDGRERRRGPRREAVDIIYSNRRYGKDRRLSGERRNGWPKGGHIR